MIFSSQMDYEKQTVAQLKELCAQRGLSTPNKAKKADYIEILKSSPAVPPAEIAGDDVWLPFDADLHISLLASSSRLVAFVLA
jgi:hypothetical protein